MWRGQSDFPRQTRTLKRLEPRTEVSYGRSAEASRPSSLGAEIPLILLGACSGAGTITAALRAIQDEAQSKVPALGYTVPYAVGDILLTAWGPVIVALVSMGR